VFDGEERQIALLRLYQGTIKAHKGSSKEGEDSRQRAPETNNRIVIQSWTLTN
jgi:hypothetical protein